MQTTDTDLLFQTNQQLDANAQRKRKAVAAEKVGSPIQVSSKVLDITVQWPDAWTAESGWLARHINLQTGETKRVYKGHQGPVTAVAVWNTGKWLALFTASWDKSVRIWDAHTGELKHELKGHTDFVKSLTVIPHPHPVLLTTSSDRSIRLWDLRSLLDTDTGSASGASGASGEAPRSALPVKEHSRPVDCCSWRVDESGHLAIWTADSMGVIKEWEIVDGGLRYVRDWKGHETSVSCLHPVEDGLWSVSMDKNVIFHPFTTDAARPTIMSQKRYLKTLTSLTLAGRSYAVSGGEDEDLHLWDVSGLPADRPKVKTAVEGHSGEISRVLSLGGIRGQGWVAVSTALDGTIRRWTAQELLEPQPLVYERKKEETSLTEEEERELAELMSDDE